VAQSTPPDRFRAILGISGLLRRTHEEGRLMVEKRRFRSVMPLYQKSTHVGAEPVDPFRIVSILKLSQGPMEKADLMQMLEASIEEIERAVTILAGRGIIKVEPSERPEKDMVSL
jgi:hypothetical protein